MSAHPHCRLGLVVLLEFFNEQVGDASATGGFHEGASDIRVQTGGEFDLATTTSDIMREVLGGSVPEVVHATLAVFLIGGLLPDFTNLISDSVSEDAPLDQTIEEFVTFLLIQFLASHDVERLVLTLEQGDCVIHSTRGEFDIEAGSVLPHEVDAVLHDSSTIGADDTEQADHQRNLHATIEGIADAQLEFEIILLNLHGDVLEGVVGEHPSTALRDIDMAVELHALALEDFFSTTNERLVLDDAVAFRHGLEALARVLADIAEERGFRAIGEVQANLFDLVERVVRDLAGLLDFEDLVFHMRVFLITTA